MVLPNITVVTITFTQHTYIFTGTNFDHMDLPSVYLQSKVLMYLPVFPPKFNLWMFCFL
jgi:hypothetical protein